MAVTQQSIQLGGLARKLVIDGMLSEGAAFEAIQKANEEGVSLVSHVVGKKLADAGKVAQAVAEEFGAPVLDISALQLDLEVTKLVDERLIRKHTALPLYKRGNRLFVGISDPANLSALDEIKFHTHSSVEAIVVEDDKLRRTIDKALDAADTTMNDIVGADTNLEGLDGLEVAEEETERDDSNSDIDDAPVVRFVNKLLLDAIRKGASDIHIEPYEKFCRVRFRLDGVLDEVARPPLALSAKIAARIKVMARLDVSERRVPQDGRIKLKLSKNKAIDFRVSTLPTLFGEKTVMRILDSSMSIPLADLGYEDSQLQEFLVNLRKPYGMFLVTGPTGSGKTLSLYSGINILNEPAVNIATAEDPVEINLPGVNQVQVNERTGMTFEKALRAFLRQDPDIILVGEIRDATTGNIAIKAAQTGHMVMSTLHTNDAPQTLSRMVDMGIPRFAIASTVNIITAQRLGRRLCGNCKRPVDMTSDALVSEGFSEEQIEAMTVYEAVGCDSCNGGYKGRVGIYQVMPISDDMKHLIMDGSDSIGLAAQAVKEGIPDIRQSALNKVAAGMTDITEINRVTIDA